MSAPQRPDSPRALQHSFTVFQGSSPEDVSHARQFWSSMSLRPPLESRLVSADIHQRLPVSRPAVRGRRPSPAPVAALELQGERRRYEAMADRRKEILALLGRQRERRIRKEQPREAVRPRRRKEEEEEEEEEEMVRQLQ